jgi:hypothetical protein
MTETPDTAKQEQVQCEHPVTDLIIITVAKYKEEPGNELTIRLTEDQIESNKQLIISEPECKFSFLTWLIWTADECCWQH